MLIIFIIICSITIISCLIVLNIQNWNFSYEHAAFVEFKSRNRKIYIKEDEKK